CLSILREFPKAAGLASRFGLAATADQLDLVRKALEEKGWMGVTPPELLHYRIGIAKNELLSPDDLRAGKGAHVLRDDLTFLAEVYDLYERQLKLNRVIDFDDCIFKTVRLLRESPDVK